MLTLVTSIVLLMALAALIDHLMNERAVMEWRKTTYALRRELDTLDVEQATRASNEWFRGLFDAVYDKRPWSWRRAGRSCISSLLALALIVLALGWQETLFGQIIDILNTNLEIEILIISVLFLTDLVLIFVPILSNLVADYVSLQETRLVMRWSSRGSASKLMLWSLVDLMLTAMIVLLFGFLLIFDSGFCFID